MIKEKSQAWCSMSQILGLTFAKLPLKPLFYTWLTLPIGALGLIAITQHHIFLGIVLFIASGICDLIDGAVARHTNNTSALGAFLDGSFDRFIDFMLLFSYFWLHIHTPGFASSKWICLAIFFAIMPSFEVAYANHRKALDDDDEKINWRILNRGEMFVLMLLVPLLSAFSASWAGYVLVTTVVLSMITTLQTIINPIRFHQSE